MTFIGFQAGSYNTHYEGRYDQAMMEWRRLGAIDKANNIVSLVEPSDQNIKTVLEVGCGTGAVLSRLKALGLGQHHVGIDLSDPDSHRDRVANDIELIGYDGRNIPFPDHSFDLVYASHVLEHVEDERGFLREMTRVAKNIIYVEVPCELNIRSNVSNLQKTLNIGHINSYTPESFSLTLCTSGLEVSDVRVFDHSPEVHAFSRSKLKAALIMKMRRAALAASPKWASRIFTYHVGAICTVPQRTKLGDGESASNGN